MSTAADTIATIRACGGDPLDLPFWEGCSAGKFLLHRCGICGRHYWPASRCVKHGAEDMAWVESSGRGEIYTYTTLHHAYTPSMKGKTPYVVAVIKLDEGPFFHAGIFDIPVDQVSVGLRVQTSMVPHDSGLTLPMFGPETHTAN